MNRRNVILSALLAAQLILVLVIYRPHEANNASEITILDMEPGRIESLVISDDYGGSVILQKRGDKWFIDPPEDYPADTGRIKSVLRKISHLSSSRLVSRARGSRGRLRVSSEKFNRRLKIKDTEGKEYVIYLGTTQGKGVYARNGVEDDIVFLDNIASWEFATSPGAWWKTGLVDVDPDALKGVGIENSHGAFMLARNGDGNWTDESGNVLDQAKVRKLLDAVKDIRVSEYLKKNAEEKLEKPEATVKFIPEKGRGVILQISSAEKEKSDRLVKISTEPHLVKVHDSGVQQVTGAKLKALKALQRKETDTESTQEVQSEGMK